jgi:RNA-binding protein
MNNLTPALRRALKARAHHLQPVVMVGDAGLTPAVAREIDVNLKSHELIKIRLLGDDRDVRGALINDICTQLDAAAVQHIGKVLVIYRPRPDNQPVAALRKTLDTSGAGRKTGARPRVKKGPRRTKRSFQA